MYIIIEVKLFGCIVSIIKGRKDMNKIKIFFMFCTVITLSLYGAKHEKGIIDSGIDAGMSIAEQVAAKQIEGFSAELVAQLPDPLQKKALELIEKALKKASKVASKAAKKAAHSVVCKIKTEAKELAHDVKEHFTSEDKKELSVQEQITLKAEEVLGIKIELLSKLFDDINEIVESEFISVEKLQEQEKALDALVKEQDVVAYCLNTKEKAVNDLLGSIEASRAALRDSINAFEQEKKRDQERKLKNEERIKKEQEEKDRVEKERVIREQIRREDEESFEKKQKEREEQLKREEEIRKQEEEKERKEKEELRFEEEERKKQEEWKERVRQEGLIRDEEERLEKEEKERVEREQKEKEEEERIKQAAIDKAKNQLINPDSNAKQSYSFAKKGALTVGTLFGLYELYSIAKQWQKVCDEATENKALQDKNLFLVALGRECVRWKDLCVGFLFDEAELDEIAEKESKEENI
jgi:hypothetical protein